MLRAQRVLFTLYGAFWISAAALAGSGFIDLGLSSGRGILTLLMLGNGVALCLAAWVAGGQNRLIWYGAFALVCANAALSLTDEIGPLDLAAFVTSIILLILLVRNRCPMGAADDTSRRTAASKGE